MPFKRNCRHRYKKRLLYKRSRLAATTYDNQALLEPRPTRSKGSVVAIESEDVAIVLGNSPPRDVPALDIQLGTSIGVENQYVDSFNTLLSSIVFKWLK